MVDALLRWICSLSCWWCSMLGTAHDLRFFALPVALFLGFAFVVELLALRKADLAFHAAALVVEVQRDKRMTLLLDLADELRDLFAVQQQLARADRVRMDVGRCFRQRADVRADQEQFSVANDDVAFLDLAAAGPERLDFPPFQHEPRLVAILDEVIEEGFSVVDDAHE